MECKYVCINVIYKVSFVLEKFHGFSSLLSKQVTKAELFTKYKLRIHLHGYLFVFINKLSFLLTSTYAKMVIITRTRNFSKPQLVVMNSDNCLRH